MTEPRSFHSKIAGVSHANPDGTERQDIIKNCKVGEVLLLLLDPDNPVSKTAVKVSRVSGEQLGYLPSRLGGEVYRLLIKDQPVHAHISDITGGTSEAPTRGVNIRVTKFVAASEKRFPAEVSV